MVIQRCKVRGSTASLGQSIQFLLRLQKRCNVCHCPDRSWYPSNYPIPDVFHWLMHLIGSIGYRTCSNLISNFTRAWNIWHCSNTTRYTVGCDFFNQTISGLLTPIVQLYFNQSPLVCWVVVRAAPHHVYKFQNTAVYNSKVFWWNGLAHFLSIRDSKYILFFSFRLFF